MERVKRFELSTSSLARKRSSQLSYTRITKGCQKYLVLSEMSTGLPDLSSLTRGISQLSSFHCFM